MKQAALMQKPIIRENLRYIWFFLGAAVLVEVLTFVIQYSAGSPFRFEPYNTLVSLSIVFIPMFTVNTIYLFKHSFIHHFKSDVQILAFKVAAMYIGIITATVCFEGIFHYFGFEDDDYIAMGTVEFSPSTSEVISNVFYATVIGIPIFLRQQIKMNTDKELALKGDQLERVKHLNTQARLETLQAKVNPHFLHNSLNSIASLVHDSPDQAESMIISLSELFRYSLNYKDDKLSTVKQEIEMVQTYMNIELIRFQEQLEFTVEIGDGLGSVRIPRFLLQPLVENAIKHGTSKVKNGKIKIEIYKNEEGIVFSLTDNGPPFSDSLSLGYGVNSVISQLEILFPKSHKFEMMNEPEKQIRIIIPTSSICL